MPATLPARPALIGAGLAVVALLAGCSADDADTAPATPAPTATSATDRLAAIWNGNVLSADKDAVCAESGSGRLEAFQAQVTPWLAGTPTDLVPSEADMTAFVDQACAAP